MMKMSIVVPVYNVKDYLGECIESILNQTYKAYEVILVDDGSNDGSGLLCDRFVQENPDRIAVIHKSNQGPLPARLDGINQAQGDVILFLDADDSFREDALEKIANAFVKYNCDMVMFDTGASESYPTVSVSHSLTEELVYRAETKKTLYHKLITYQIPNGVCLKAVRREYTRIGEHLGQCMNAKHGEDLLMSAWFMTGCKSAVYIKEGLYRYRARPGSAIHSFHVHRKESIKTVHTELEKCIDNWDMPELKPLHNTRKVKGWIDNFILLYKNKKHMDSKEYKKQRNSMAKDPYFRTAYKNMDKSQMPLKYRLVAMALYYGYAVIGCF
jgi:glycosyltransferase involved in cell wall biosynthesis